MQDKYRRIRFYCGLTDKHGEIVDPVTYEHVLEDFSYPSFTMYKAQGNWLGMREDTIVLEILELWPMNELKQAYLESHALTTARELKMRGQQDTVLVTTEFVETIFV